MPTFYDLNVPLEDSPSEPLGVKITHNNHGQTAPQMAEFLQVAVSDLTGGQGWATDHVEANTHNGTHVDAPWHYYPTSMGKPARKIDEMPLEWFFQNGVRLDFRHKTKGARISVEDLQGALQAINYELKAFDIVMLWTDTDKLWGQAGYFTAGAGLTKASTLWLLEQGVRVIGTDCWGLDRPLWATTEQFKQDGDAEKLWEAHRAGIEQEYCQIEKLANLDQLPQSTGFKVACFPVKIKGGSAGWTRVVAIVD
ncbi:MAG: cyclase family protein [Puniceicoccaceae bacterium]|nr:MAG: cyclase family protein [Puniceicoccaceae bacterium]